MRTEEERKEGTKGLWDLLDDQTVLEVGLKSFCGFAKDEKTDSFSVFGLDGREITLAIFSGSKCLIFRGALGKIPKPERREILESLSGIKGGGKYPAKRLLRALEAYLLG